MTKSGGVFQFSGGRMTSRGQCPRGCVLVNVLTPPFRKSCIRACVPPIQVQTPPPPPGWLATGLYGYSDWSRPVFSSGGSGNSWRWGGGGGGGEGHRKGSSIRIFKLTSKTPYPLDPPSHTYNVCSTLWDRACCLAFHLVFLPHFSSIITLYSPWMKGGLHPPPPIDPPLSSQVRSIRKRNTRVKVASRTWVPSLGLPTRRGGCSGAVVQWTCVRVFLIDLCPHTQD